MSKVKQLRLFNDDSLYRKPIFRNPDLYPVYPYMQWVRDNMPPGPQGFVCADIDMMTCRFDPRKSEDGGRFTLYEIKTHGGKLSYAQRMMYSNMHNLLRGADPSGETYGGFHLIHWDNGHYLVNGKQWFNDAGLKKFLSGELKVDSLFD